MNTQSAPTHTPKAQVRLDKGTCSWCTQPGKWEITVDGWTDVACTEHKIKWFPEAVTPVSLVKRQLPYPAGKNVPEWMLDQRRTSKIPSPSYLLSGHVEGLRDCEPLALESAFRLSLWIQERGLTSF